METAKDLTGDIWPKHLDAVSSLSEVFVPYVTKKLTIGKPHPDPLVEPVGLSLVDPPDITYHIKMRKELYEPDSNGVCHVSQPQLETITYAMQTFEKKIQLEADGELVTRGYFLGAGTGTGKTRELAGLIYEHSLNGGKKFLWVTTSRELFSGIEKELHAFDKNIIVARLKISYKLIKEETKPVVLLQTYLGLADSNAESVRNTWLTNEFDGVVVLDEVHKAKSAYSKKKASIVGKNVLLLQKKYPAAKFIYSTATSASELNHLRVMQRLGIWGPGTPFKNEAKFNEKIKEADVAGMEVLALRLKKEGVFSSKVIDFSKCNFHCVDATEQNDFEQTFERYSQMWTLLMEYRNRIHKEYRDGVASGKYVLEDLEEDEDMEYEDDNHEKKIRRSNNGSFYSDCLLFFSSIIKSSKIFTASEITRDALKYGKSVIIGLQHTGDALFQEFKEEPGSEGKPYSNALLILRRAMLDLGIEVGCPKYYGKGFPNGTPLWDWDKKTEESINKRARASAWRHRIDYRVMYKSAKRVHKVEPFENWKKMEVFQPYYFGAYFLSEKGPLKKPRHLSWSYNEARRDLTPASLAKLYHELSFWLPINGIDELISRIEKPLKLADGKVVEIRVAELTGRDHQYRFDNNTRCWKSEERDMATKKRKAVDTKNIANTMKKVSKGSGASKKIISNEIDAFMNGPKRVAIISGAASTGVSLHADKSCKNKQQRIHITLEYSYGPENIVQQLGRSNRSNQSCSPEYFIINSRVPAEIRVTCIAGKRVRMLGAICYGHINGAVISKYLCDDFSTHEQSRAAIEHGFTSVPEKYEALMDSIGLSGVRASSDTENEGFSRKYFTTKLETYAKKVFNKVMVMPLKFQKTFVTEASSFLNNLVESKTVYSPIKDIDLRLYEPGGVQVLSHHKFGNTSIYHYKLSRWCSWSAVKEGYSFYMRRSDHDYETLDIVAVKDVERGAPDYNDNYVEAVFPFCSYKVRVDRKKLLDNWHKVDPIEYDASGWWLKYAARPADMTESRPGCVHVQKNVACPISFNARGKHCLRKWGDVQFVLMLNPDFQLVSTVQEKFGCTQLVRFRYPVGSTQVHSLIGLVVGQEEVRAKPSEVFNFVYGLLRASENSQIITSREDDDDSFMEDDPENETEEEETEEEEMEEGETEGEDKENEDEEEMEDEEEETDDEEEETDDEEEETDDEEEETGGEEEETDDEDEETDDEEDEMEDGEEETEDEEGED